MRGGVEAGDVRAAGVWGAFVGAVVDLLGVVDVVDVEV